MPRDKKQVNFRIFQPHLAFAGNTGPLSINCHPFLCHGNDSMETALLRFIKGGNAHTGLWWAHGASELRYTINHSHVGIKQFVWVYFYFSAQKTVLSSWCSPKPQLGLDWQISHWLCSEWALPGSWYPLVQQLEQVWMHLMGDTTACVLNLRLGSTVQSTVSHQKCTERWWLPPMQPEDSQSINKPLDSSDEFPSWVQAKKLPNKDRDNNLQENDSFLHFFGLCIS